MSNMVNFEIACKDINTLLNLSFDFKLVDFCSKKRIGVTFKPRCNTSIDHILYFKLSDSFYVLNCDEFMAPVYFSTDSKIIYGIEKLNSDIKTIKDICEFCFEYEEISNIIIKISCAEVDEQDYTTYHTSLNLLESLILDEYLCTCTVPNIKMCVSK